MHSRVKKVLYSEDQIASKVKDLARIISRDYEHERPIIVTTLKGAVIFMADLVRCLDPVPDGLQIEFIKAASYGSGMVSSGNVALSMSTLSDERILNRHILLVEDIVDSGRTGVHLREYFSIRGASSVRMVSLLSKPSRREVEFEPDYLGFTIEDEFVVGYGLDIDRELRSLPYIGILATV